MLVDVCICTHNPRRDLLHIVLTAIAHQTLDKEHYQVWIIDNCSNPKITSTDLAPLEAAGVTYKILWEPKLGLSYARCCAIEATQAEVVVFVDDDNELADDYLENVVAIAKNNSEIGCFGGKLLLPSKVSYPVWMQPLLPYLGIKDCGNKVISSSVNHWGEWEPAGAGVVVRRQVLDLYLRRLKAMPTSAGLGRRGRNGLFSSEDALMVRGAYEFGLQCSYQPQLVLKHHLHSKRFKFTYLFKLLYCYGRSYVILERSLGNDPPVLGVRGAVQSIVQNMKIRQTENFLHALCLMAWDVGYFQELRFGERNYAYRKDLIFDIGMHIGQDTEFYLAKGFKVIAIEANPLLVKEAEVKFADSIKNHQLVILNIGIDEKKGKFSFYVNDTYSEWSSFIKEIGMRGGSFHELTVPCLTIDEVFAKYGTPYYLKVDIEGHDIHVVKRLKDLKAKPKYVSVENGNGGLLECLYEAGYEQFKFINQAVVPEMKCPKPALEGQYIDHIFLSGSSGPFGEETIGMWKTYEQVAIEINAYWNIPDRDANIHGWFDLHAKLGACS